jgi:hypothetical protein
MASAAISESGTDPQVFRSAFRIMVVLGLLTLAISGAGRLAGGAISHGGNSDKLRKHEIVIANSVFSVSENLIRMAEQRSQGVKSRLDLFAVWPRMEGYSESRRPLFDGTSAEPPSLLFISIEPRQMSRDMSGRLAPIYTQLIEPNSENGPVAGMRSHAFKADRAVFADERLFVVGPMDQPVFVARCIDGPQAEDTLAPCERDVFFEDDLTVKYRFPRRLLAEYGALDREVMAFINSMAVTALK